MRGTPAPQAVRRQCEVLATDLLEPSAEHVVKGARRARPEPAVTLELHMDDCANQRVVKRDLLPRALLAR
eukprot:3709258-Pyramimonas_sp.AAC.1